MQKYKIFQNVNYTDIHVEGLTGLQQPHVESSSVASFVSSYDQFFIH